jgi:hypothetical protein
VPGKPGQGRPQPDRMPGTGGIPGSGYGRARTGAVCARDGPRQGTVGNGLPGMLAGSVHGHSFRGRPRRAVADARSGRPGIIRAAGVSTPRRSRRFHKSQNSADVDNGKSAGHSRLESVPGTSGHACVTPCRARIQRPRQQGCAETAAHAADSAMPGKAGRRRSQPGRMPGAGGDFPAPGTVAPARGLWARTAHGRGRKVCACC